MGAVNPGGYIPDAAIRRRAVSAACHTQEPVIRLLASASDTDAVTVAAASITTSPQRDHTARKSTWDTWCEVTWYTALQCPPPLVQHIP